MKHVVGLDTLFMYVLAAPHDMQDLHSTRDWIHAPCSGSTEFLTRGLPEKSLKLPILEGFQKHYSQQFSDRKEQHQFPGYAIRDQLHHRRVTRNFPQVMAPEFQTVLASDSDMIFS